MGKFKQAARGSILILVGSLIGSVFAYLFRMVLTRKVSVEEYGLFSSVLAFVILFEIFRNLGLYSALVKYVSKSFALGKTEEGKKIVFITIIVEILLAVLIAISLKFLDGYLALNYFKQSFAPFVLNWVLIYFLIETVSTGFQHAFLGIQKTHLFAIKKPLFNILTFVFVFLFPISDARLPIMALVAGLLGSTIVLSFFFFKNFLPFVKLRVDDFKRIMPQLLKFGLPITLASLGNITIAQFDTIMLTVMGTLKEVGIYNIILPFALILGFIGQGVERVIFPLTSEFQAKNTLERIKKSLDVSYRFTLSATMIVSLPLLLFSGFLLDRLFGAEYVLGATAFQILIVGIIFSIIGGINLNVLYGLGYSKISSIIITLSAIANVVFNLLLIPKWGISGAALATSVSFLVITFLTFFFLRKKENISFSIKKIFLFFLSWGISFIIGRIGVEAFFSNYSLILKGISSSILSMGSFGSLILLFKLFTINDIKRLFSITKKE